MQTHWALQFTRPSSLLHGEVDASEGVGDEEADAEHEFGRLLRQPRKEPRRLRLKGKAQKKKCQNDQSVLYIGIFRTAIRAAIRRWQKPKCRN